MQWGDAQSLKWALGNGEDFNEQKLGGGGSKKYTEEEKRMTMKKVSSKEV